ncbi:MFS transporter [Pseudoclavibacter endophyticus]|uniref:MHS family MFS transporter n=1 Tax=Pseudoclavibacter endophyticus TaxID=1778590 RepID=A0A6H9WSB8_9MICO|nr:MFS transporter [Pseudoclavibacter endophyticus]KAB1649224.1 MHS family MFS transporter [Pseudoclavibacter endophyticus]GGA64382.1 MFS transporter [Pseudoclavibacter endophyticus]
MTESTTTAATDTAYAASDRDMRRILLSSLAGTALEYYDFILYATAAGIVFNHIFFTGLDPTAALVVSFGTLAAGYVARPLGGIIFGSIGDRIGRKTILMLTVLIMGVTSTLIGLLPTTDQIGLMAPILLVTLRVVQGIAVGGEWGGATLVGFENAKKRSRGFAAAFAYMGAPTGTLVGTLILAWMATMPQEDFLSWGWRVPFILSAFFMLIVVFIRRRVTESRVFLETVEQAPSRPKTPLRELVVHHWRPLLRAFTVGISGQAAQGLMGAWAVAYVVAQAAHEQSLVLLLKSSAAVTTILFIIIASRLSDRIGRRRVLVFGNVLGIALAFPIMWMLETDSVVLFFFAIFLGLSVVQGFSAGPYGAYAGEQFPTAVRNSGASVAYQFAATAGAGFTPMIATALASAGGGRLWLVALLWMGFALISLVGLLTGRDRSRLDIGELDGAVHRRAESVLPR